MSRHVRILVTHGLDGLYEHSPDCDYTPLTVLLLYAVGNITSFVCGGGDDAAVHIAIKLVNCGADLAAAVIVFMVASRWRGPRVGIGAAFFALFNPAIVYTSAYWGQRDSIHALLCAASLAMVQRRAWCGSGICAGAAILVKFQSIACIPLLILEAYRRGASRGVISCGTGALVMVLLTLVPFGVVGTHAKVLGNGYVGAVGRYDKVSYNAYNLWEIAGVSKAKDTSIIPLAFQLVSGKDEVIPEQCSWARWCTYRRVSILLFGVAVAAILSLYTLKVDEASLWGAGGLLFVAFFFLLTEMHERYAMPALILWAPWAALSQARQRMYWVVTALLLLNLAAILPPDEARAYLAGGIGLGALGMAVAVFFCGDRGVRVAADCGTDTVRERPLVRAFRWGTLAAVTVLGLCLVAAAGYVSMRGTEGASGVFLGELTPVRADQGWGRLMVDASVAGTPIHLGRNYYRRGLGTHAPSHLAYDVPDGFDEFRAVVGVDGATGGLGSVTVRVRRDGEIVFESPRLLRDSEPIEVCVPLDGAKRIELIADTAGDGKRADHVNWAAAQFRRRSTEARGVE